MLLSQLSVSQLCRQITAHRRSEQIPDRKYNGNEA